MVFDTLEQGSIAAMNGHGIAIADLHLTLDALKSGLLGLPFREAIATGMATTSSGQKFTQKESIQHLLARLQNHTPVVPALDIDYLAYDDSRIY